MDLEQLLLARLNHRPNLERRNLLRLSTKDIIDKAYYLHILRQKGIVLNDGHIMLHALFRSSKAFLRQRQQTN